MAQTVLDHLRMYAGADEARRMAVACAAAPPRPPPTGRPRRLRVSVGSATPNFFTTERVDLLTAIAGALGALMG